MGLKEKEIEQVASVAVRTALEHLEKERAKDKKRKRDYRLHNIKLLLKNYRALVIHCEDIKTELDLIDSTSIQDLDIDTINLESIESIKRSKEKSFAMVMFIRNKMQAYKDSCTDEEMRCFRVLEKKYLTEKKYTIQQIADIENIEKTTVYRDLNKAIEDLPVIFFGVDAIDFK